MKKDLLDIIVCPKTGEKFNLISFEIIKEDIIKTGILLTTNRIAYPILNGVPRLIEGAMWFYRKQLKNYSSLIKKLDINEKSYEITDEFKRLFLPTLLRFNKEWKEHNLNDKTWGWNQKERFDLFLKYVDLELDDYSNKLFLDVGAGTGELTCTIAKRLNCEIVGVDLAPSIEKGEMLNKIRADNALKVNFIQADLMNLPFRKNTFDVIHASGVLHHTPNTKKAFHAVEKHVKIYGKLGVWVYREAEAMLPLIPFIDNRFLLQVNKIRKYTTKMNPSFLYNLIFIYVASFHFLYKLNELIRGRKHKQTMKERATSLFDALAPIYVHRHKPNEIKKWFEDKNYTKIKESDFENPAGFNVCAIKQ